MIFASSSATSSTIEAASCTSIGVRSSQPVTANTIFFAHSSLISNRGFSIACLVASKVLFSHSPYPIPRSAVPESFIITLTSAKSILIRPGLIIKSDIHCTHRYNILSI